MMNHPTVTIAIPVLNEEAYLDACLDAVAAQTYANIVETLVVDGGSTDMTRELAGKRPGVRVLHNPRRIQAAALNIALAEAKGDVFVRIDGHCVVAADYVGQCVSTLARSRAAMVGGGMTPAAEGPTARGIAMAMASPVGAGPARFHTGGKSGWVDTVYLGAFHTDLARSVGGYAEDLSVNEDAEFAIRMRPNGGVWYDPAIKSTYVPRSDLSALARQFYRYGVGRAATVRRHPASLSFRQLAAPILIVGLVSKHRRAVAGGYVGLVLGEGWRQCHRDPASLPAFAAALPVMHLSWGAGFLSALVSNRAGALSADRR